MSAHPDLKPEDARKIVNWILSLSKNVEEKSLPAQGKIIASAKDADKNMLITASYTDKGGPNIKSLTGTASAGLKTYTLTADDKSDLENVNIFEFNNRKFVVPGNTKGWIS
jgi:hypothetical protein